MILPLVVTVTVCPEATLLDVISYLLDVNAIPSYTFDALNAAIVIFLFVIVNSLVPIEPA